MSFKPKTIRRSPAQLRNYMRSYNEIASGLRKLRKLIEMEVKLAKERKRSIKKVREEQEEAEELFKE